jgi:hypothetical protein
LTLFILSVKGFDFSFIFKCFDDFMARSSLHVFVKICLLSFLSRHFFRDGLFGAQDFECFSLGLSDQFASESVGTLVVHQIAKSDSSQLIEIVVVQEHVASGEGAVTTSSTNFLNVILNTAGHVEVNDSGNITLIDSHRKSDRTYKDTSSVFAE